MIRCVKEDQFAVSSVRQKTVERQDGRIHVCSRLAKFPEIRVPIAPSQHHFRGERHPSHKTPFVTLVVSQEGSAWWTPLKPIGLDMQRFVTFVSETDVAIEFRAEQSATSEHAGERHYDHSVHNI